MMIGLYIVLVVVGIVVGVVASMTFLNKKLTQKSYRLLKDAEEKSELIKKNRILEAQEKISQLEKEHEKTIHERNSVVSRNENRVKQKENTLNQKIEDATKKESEAARVKEEYNDKIKALDEQRADIENLHKQEIEKLEQIAGLSSQEAKKQLIDTIKEAATIEGEVVSREIIDEAKLSANAEAKKIVIETIQRTATETAIENTVSVFHIDSDEVKGRIIGREGRNIKALESLTGVELVIDDTPDTITISGFDPVRREIARLSLHKLVTDGRIHPGRIEEVVAKTTKQMEQELLEIGKRTCVDLGIHGMNFDLVRLIGKMKFRSSYGQNLLQHSIEVANLCATMAAELGLDTKKAKRAGLLHDIGKVPDQEPDLPHAIYGMKLAEKCKEKPDICNAIGAHHEEIEMTSMLSPLVQVCDAISGARPGARREIVEDYIARLNKLEELAHAYNGVINSYAIQAGRELRVIVDAEHVSDEESQKISLDLSSKIQSEMTYPGQVKVMVIRETRAINYAK